MVLVGNIILGLVLTFVGLVPTANPVGGMSGTNNDSIIDSQTNYVTDTPSKPVYPYGLYGTDCGNDRVQRFSLEQVNETTVAEKGSLNITITVNCPCGITLDADDYLFIVGSSQHRIVEAGPNEITATNLDTTSTTALDTTSTTTLDTTSTTISGTTRASTTTLDTTRASKTTVHTTRASKTTVDATSTTISGTTRASTTTSDTTSATTSSTTTSDTTSNTTSDTTRASTTTVDTTSTTTSDTTSSTTSDTTGATTSSTTTSDTTSNTTSDTTSNTTSDTTTSTTSDTTTSTTLDITGATTSSTTSTSTTSETDSLTNIESFTTVFSINPLASLAFVPQACFGLYQFGPGCNILSEPCIMLQPCQNNGTCINNNSISNGYHCVCSEGFYGMTCQFDQRPCQSNTCWNDGICNETMNTTFECFCQPGWEGIHCETKINYCENVTCLNHGVCRPSLLNYTCECLGTSFSGRYCEKVTSTMFVHQIITKSFGYISILFLTSVCIFIIVMDLLKYCFGCDPTTLESEKIRQKKRMKQIKGRRVISRYIYVN